MKNLEIKAPAPDLPGLKARALAAGARTVGVLKQVDTYYQAARGLLKLRVVSGAGAELIAYSRPLVEGSRVSDYAVYPVDEPGALKEILERSLLRVVEVRKSRDLLMWGGTRIHLDEVDGLGTFIELETEGDSRGPAAMREEHERVITALGLDRAGFLAGSYADMLRDKMA